MRKSDQPVILLDLNCKQSIKSKNIYFQVDDQPVGKDNIAYKWGAMALTATANDTEKFKPRPTVTSRYLGLIFTAVFDAWSRYDEKAIPVYLENVERRPQAENTITNKEIAISYAAYGAMKEYYYRDSDLFTEFMIKMGLDPENKSTDPSTPAGIGNLAAHAVIEARKHDGSNQYGDEKILMGNPILITLAINLLIHQMKMLILIAGNPNTFLMGKAEPLHQNA